MVEHCASCLTIGTKRGARLGPEIRIALPRPALPRRRLVAHDCRDHKRDVCKPCCEAGGSGGINACAKNTAAYIPPEPQDPGDPVQGRDTLLNGDFMTCGVPYKIWQFGALFQDTIASGFGGSASAPRITDRTGVNADIPYFLNVFTASNGADVINANCLMCHGGLFDGQLVIGMGNPIANFTQNVLGQTTTINDDILDALGLNQAEKDQWHTVAGRGAVLGPRTTMRTIGMNPAEMYAVILVAHHDQQTLAWSDDELIPVEVKDHDGNPIPNALVTSDPPPWWRVHKKNALFYNGMARGDHRGTMALATSVCVDDVTRAQEVDAMFKDINAFIETVRAPTYPRSIDAELAATGQQIFLTNCAMCHGTYDADEANETYPNLLVPLDTIGTDPVVAEAGVVHAPELVDWYNGSFYGGITRMEPNDPFPGYMPPPLDGIWATAPYLHNGSVPTVALLLNSGARPTYWRRVDLDSTHFDEDALGWPWVEVDSPQADLPPGEAKMVYDTTYFSQSNDGHPFGDHLTPEERRAVIEYLKTL
jgi:mono/diheme cytochrome c family protein